MAIQDVGPPALGRSEALIRVAAISLNRGEVRRAQAADAGWRPGWDLAGVVEAAAADGTGPQPGARVVGLLNSGAWADLVAVPARSLAALPDSVTFAQAATLPVAGLTALHTLGKGGNLLAKNVLITGASGGVGHLAVQLARHAGAHVVGLVHQDRHVEPVRRAGAHQVVLGEDGAPAAQHAPYDLILDSVGGATLGTVLAQLAPNGTCVAFGSTAGGEVTFDLRRFFLEGGLTLYGFILFHELEHGEPASIGLDRLARLVAGGQLRPQIEVEASWTEVGVVAQQLVDRRFAGKAVLYVRE
jgi:NADPH:quinone reductase-like Zn-dependent oxidoreductase